MSLTTQQEQVLALISAGNTISDAGFMSGIHRNTIHNWLRSAPEFISAVTLARESNALYWREKAEEYAAEALDTIQQLMLDPKTPAATRLRAAQFILNLTIHPKLPHSMHNLHNSAQPAEDGAGAFGIEGLPEPEPEKVHNSAQQLEPQQPEPQQPEPQQPYRRPSPKIGRNELCPCGSGRKFKRCCADKVGSVPSPAVEAA